MDATSPAGFWIRTVALAIDFAVFFLVRVSYGVVAHLVTGIKPEDSWTLGPSVAMFTLLFAAVYTTTLHATWGQTIGKMVTGVRVLDVDGEPPRVGASLLRYAGYVVSAVPMFLGYVMAGLRTDKRALHDLIAGTRVERLSRRGASAPEDPVETPPTAERVDSPPA